MHGDLMGMEAKDIVTGFKGTVTGYCRYLTGCHQYLLMPKTDPKKPLEAPDGCWYDETRVEAVGRKIVQLKTDKVRAPSTGADMAAPTRS